MIKAQFTGLAVTVLTAFFLCTGPAEAAAQRVTHVLDTGWRFTAEDVPAAVAPTFNDSNWQSVTIPHSWNRVGYYLSGQLGVNRATSVNKAQGLGWYRLKFRTPDSAGPRQSWLEFDAASRVARVWLNGIFLGEHRGGFSRFRFDATQAIKPKGENVLVVSVDNTKPAAGGPTQDVLPLTGDFFVHGGLYRPVRLVTTDAIHIDLADHGGPGVYAVTGAASAAEATIHLRARIVNATAQTRNLRVRSVLTDRQGQAVAIREAPLTLAAHGVDETTLSLKILSPHLWQGTYDPYLYDLTVEVRDAKGVVHDLLTQKFGIRTMAFDANRGFLLNGMPYKLHGVGYHQDRDGKGWAIRPEDVEEDVATLREMGANSLRLTHYQHGSIIHDIADREGIILWDEIPLVSQWTLGGQQVADPKLVANARQQLSELIRQNYNHAASAIWSIGNEVDFGNSLPAFLTGGADGRDINPMPLLTELRALAQQEDPSRPTALATCCEGRLFAPNVTIPITAQAADLGGANRYFGWYFGQASDLGPHLDELRAKRPQQPLAVTEYGAGGALTIHTDNVLGGAIDPRGRAQPEEYESYIHETAWPQLEARPWLYATWLWNAFDFATTVRTEGDAQDINTKGLIAYDHMTRKDAYYFYKAHWTSQPMVHITGRRAVARAYGVTDVRVYSNVDRTALFLNGRSLGAQEKCPNRICVWPNVTLDVGRNALRAVGESAAGQAEDEIFWTLAPEKRDHVVIDAGALVAAKGHDRTLGSDNWVTGGRAASLDIAADYGRPAQPVAIAGTQERDAMASYRTGNFSYAIPVPAGTYLLKLWFVATPDAVPGGFDVAVNGKLVLKNVHSTAPAGSAAAFLEQRRVTSNGQVKIDFVAKSGEPKLSILELEPVH